MTHAPSGECVAVVSAVFSCRIVRAYRPKRSRDRRRNARTDVTTVDPFVCGCLTQRETYASNVVVRCRGDGERPRLRPTIGGHRPRPAARPHREEVRK